MSVKVYRTTCFRTCADGSVKHIYVDRKYTVKGVYNHLPPAETIKEIKSLYELGLSKTKICEKYNISNYILTKVLALSSD